MPNVPFADVEAQVGETHETVRGFAVEAGKVAEFARAIHDPADVYTDPQAADAAGFDGVPAPPTFTRTSFFPRYRPEEIDHELGFDIGFEREYVLHGEQRYRYDRPLVVGDTLTGETTLENAFQREGARANLTFAVFRTDFYDEAGERVQSAWNTRIETDAAPGGDEERVDIPDSPAVETSALERRDFVKYAGASGDFNPIHYDEPYATGAGHPSVFAQGMFTAGVASRGVRERVGLAALRTLRTRFSSRVFPGDALAVTVERDGDEADTFDLAAVTDDGRTAMTGSATTR